MSNQLAALSAQLPAAVNRASSNSVAAGLDDNVLLGELLGLELRCDPSALERTLRSAFCLQRPDEVTPAEAASPVTAAHLLVARPRRGRSRRLNMSLHEDQDDEEKPASVGDSDGRELAHVSVSESSTRTAGGRRRAPLHTSASASTRCDGPDASEYIEEAEAAESAGKKYRLNPAGNTRNESIKRAKHVVGVHVHTLYEYTHSRSRLTCYPLRFDVELQIRVQ